RQVFVHTPTGRTMVDDHLLDRIATDIVGSLAAFAHTAANPQVANDDVASVDVERSTSQTDAVPGGGLPRDGDVGVVDIEVALQANNPGNAKHNDARTLGGNSFAKAAGATVVEIGDGDDL